MSLGETIYRLRTEKGLSQGDLAERLEVSRQSVSKWENNSAVPDLEKIIKLSDIFEVSLDELVKGEAAPRRESTVTDMPQAKKKETGFLPRKIAGTILLCMAFFVVMLFAVLSNSLGGLVLALPFITCGILCFALKKNVGLWCAWDVYVLFDMYITFATGINRSMVWYSLRWTPHLNYARLAFAWVLALSLVVMVVVTMVRLGKVPFNSEQKGHRKMIGAWVALVVVQAAAMLWGRSDLYKNLAENSAEVIERMIVLRLIPIVLSWAKIIALTAALVFTSRFIKTVKQK